MSLDVFPYYRYTSSYSLINGNIHASWGKGFSIRVGQIVSIFLTSFFLYHIQIKCIIIIS